MRKEARRLLSHMMGRSARRAQLMLCVGLSFLVPGVSVAQSKPSAPLLAARYLEPTTRYAHGVLGDTIEHGALELSYGGGESPRLIRLPKTRVFEDTEPRLVDVDSDGRSEVMVVESHQNQGARLAIYNGFGLIAATPYIGRRSRWLAPVGASDLDGDGAIEIAYVDRPHLAKVLRVWRFEKGELIEVASLDGVTNHRIGERDIAGGIRNCGKGPEMIVARADWQRLIAVTFDGSKLSADEIAPHSGRESFTNAMACK